MLLSLFARRALTAAIVAAAGAAGSYAFRHYVDAGTPPHAQAGQDRRLPLGRRRRKPAGPDRGGSAPAGRRSLTSTRTGRLTLGGLCTHASLPARTLHDTPARDRADASRIAGCAGAGGAPCVRGSAV